MPLIAAAIITCGFTACSNDDDSNGDNIPNGPTASYNGRLLKHTGDMTFSYDEKGRCTDVTLDHEADGFMHIDYNKRTMTIEDETYNITFTDKGYLSTLSASFSESDGGYTMKMEGRITFNYDAAGHLTGGTNNATGTVTGNGIKYTQTSQAVAKYTWNGNLLTKVYSEEKNNENGQIETETTTYNITYSDIDNKYCQWTHAAEEYMLSGDCAGFVGLMGKSPAKLVDSFTETEVDNGQEQRPYTKNVTYTLNNDGTIKTEKIDHYSYTYTYMTYGDSNDSGAKTHSLSLITDDENGRTGTITPLGLHKRMKEMKKRLGVQNINAARH